jgi:Carboxypeptidase regulatory-like domain
MECSPISKGLVELPDKASSIRIEGPEHGPVSLSRGSLKEGPDGLAVVKVPRKAFLEVAGKPGTRTTVSLYRLDDSTFRTPGSRMEAGDGETVRIPAGEFVASLSSPGNAPELNLLSASPAERYKLTRRDHPGWSLVLRCLSEKDGAALEDASVEIRGTEGFAGPGNPIQKTVAGPQGIVLVSGLSHPLASAVIESPGHAARREEGLAASPGTFLFREIRLERAAVMRASVTEQGRPSVGATCQVLEYEVNPLGPVPEPTVRSEGRTDAEGVCRSKPLPPGPYRLRVRLKENRARVERAVDLAPGENLVDVDFVPILVQGRVRRGSEPAASHVVLFYDADNPIPNAIRRNATAEATTDEEGNYEVRIWSPGSYFAQLETPRGTPADGRQIWLEAGERQVVDFDLEAHSVAGAVVDDRDQPVAEARVGLFWNRVLRLAQTDEQGKFEFPLTEPGQGRVEVRKEGYRQSPPTEVSAEPGQPPAPLLLRIQRAGLISGRIVRGGPVAGALLASFRVGTDGGAQYLGTASSDREGRFEIAGAEDGVTRIFVTGASCPLTSFEVRPSTDDLTLACPDSPASLSLEFQDTAGGPLAGRSVLILRDGILIPSVVLSNHLGRFRLPGASDGSGRLLLPALAPDRYDLFLADVTSPELITAGLKQGLIGSSNLAPLMTTELQVMLDSPP